MGLDMYANKRHFVKQFGSQPLGGRISVAVMRGGKPVLDIIPDRVAWIEEEVMYWRKANHIHKWFVDNVQNGVDDCGTYHVPREKLLDLFNRCVSIMKASKLVKGKVF